MIEIKNLNIESSRETTTISADINEFRLFFKVPAAYNISACGDPFLSAAFFPAMTTGETISTDSSIVVSQKLVDGMRKLQDVFKCWHPELHNFDIDSAVCKTTQVQVRNKGIATFFSGGMDGLYTLNKHKLDITHLVFINGFDFEMSSEDFEKALLRNQKIAAQFGKIVLPVETNFWSYMEMSNIDRPMNHGSCLASVGQLLGFPSVYIPASYTFNHLHPWGSHPLTDPLWSTESTQFIHDGAEAKRTEKTENLALLDQSILDNIVVCWFNPNENCGECGKCLRTMITLKILGVTSPSFPRKIDLKNIRRLWIASHADLSYYLENIELAERYNKPHIAKALQRAVLKYRLRAIKSRVLNFF